MTKTGKLSQAVGKRFEDNCETMHEEYRLRKLGFFWKNEIGSRVIYTPRGPMTQKLPSRPDFSGVLDTGRYVTFDAKTTANKTKWTLPKKSLHQQIHMEDVARRGALAFFLLETRLTGMCYILRVVENAYFVAGGRPTVVFATARMDPNIVSFMPTGNCIDWLGALMQADKFPFLVDRGW